MRKLEFLYAVFKGLNIFFADFFITEIIFKIILVKQNILQTPIGGVVFGFFLVQLPERVVDVGFNVFRIADVCNERRAPAADKIFGLVLNFDGCRSGANAFYYAVGIFLVLSTVIKVIAEKVFVVKNKFVSLGICQRFELFQTQEFISNIRGKRTLRKQSAAFFRA